MGDGGAGVRPRAMQDEIAERAPPERGAAEAGGPSADELSTLWEVPSAGVLVLDRDLRIRSANAAFAHLVDQSAERLRGRRLDEVAPLTAQAIGAAMASALASGAPVAGAHVPYNFAELSVDALPLDARGRDPRAVVVISDTRRRPLAAPEPRRIAMFSVEKRVGRVVEARFASPLTRAEVESARRAGLSGSEARR